MKIVFYPIALLALTTGLHAAAQQDGGAGTPAEGASFCSADYAPDAAMDAADRQAAEFAEMDTDSDGMVSQEEYAACRAAAEGGAEEAAAGGDAPAAGGDVALASADLEAGADTYKVCRACHGPKAQGMASFPKLAGQEAEYLASRLHQYRDKEEVGPNSALMWPVAAKLSDEDIANVSAYIATEFE